MYLKNLGPAAFLFPSGKIVDQSSTSFSYSFSIFAFAGANDKKIYDNLTEKQLENKRERQQKYYNSLKK